MKPYIIAEGLYFSDAGLIVREPKRPTAPVFNSNTTKAAAQEMLLNAVQMGDVSIVNSALDFMLGDKICPDITAVEITKKIAKIKDVSEQILDLLDERGAISRTDLLEEMRANYNWSAVPWLLRDRENILLAEKSIVDVRCYMKTNQHSIKACCLNPLMDLIKSGGVRGAAELDLAFILRDLKLEPEEFIQNILLQAPNEERVSVEDMARLAEVIWSADTYRLMRPDMSDEQIKESMTKGAMILFRRVLNDNSTTLEGAARIERMAQLSPNLAQAMHQYWKLPNEFFLKNYPGKWSYEDLDKLSSALPGLGSPKHRDLLDCAIRLGSDWVVDALMASGPLHNQIIDRLENDDGPLMASLILSFEPTQAHNYIPKLVKTFGTKWKDSRGRGLGHYIVRASNYPTVNVLRALLRTKAGVELLAETDGGKTALSYLQEREGWDGSKKINSELIQRAKRKILDSISAKPNIDRDKRPNIKF